MSGDRLRTHLQLGRNQGLDDEALIALMALLANYLGYPRASLAMETVHASSADTPSVDVFSAPVSTAGAGTPPSLGGGDR